MSVPSETLEPNAPPPHTQSLSLPKESRILRSAEFRAVYDSGVRMTSRYFAAFCMPLALENGCTRFGFTTPRALGKAVVRNRIKRRTREAVRLNAAHLSGSWAIVFNPRKAVLQAQFDELCSEILRLFERLQQQAGGK